jgi:sulfate transport system ATP-binding protein
MSILVDNVSKSFGNFRALRHVSLEVESGSLVALVGPSGSGKSTLLRIIAGFEPPDEGTIWLCGKNATFTPVQDRNIGFVFQSYALVKTMTVYENIAFGLEIHQKKYKQFQKSQIHERVMDFLKLIRLESLMDRYPESLSGGQCQRVALARALVLEPTVLLLDEPFGALDAQVRRELRTWLRLLHTKIPVTTVLVTHDQQEAMEIATELVIFNEGRIEQIGKPQDVYDNPATPFVRRFMGNVAVKPTYKPEQTQTEPDGGVLMNLLLENADVSGESSTIISSDSLAMLKNDPVTKLVSSEPTVNVDVKETSIPLQRYLHLRPHQFDFSHVVPDPLDSSWRPMQIQSISYGGTGVKISLVVQKASRFFDELENHKQDFSKQYEGWVVRITMSPSMFRQLDLNTQQVVYIKPHDDSDFSTNSNKYEI